MESGEIVGPGGVRIGGADRSEVRVSPVERDGNVRLMATGPELFETCEDILEWLRTGKVEGVGFDDEQVIDYLAEIVAKAKGGAE